MKKNIPKLCNILCAILAAAFVIKSIADYIRYSDTLNSAPFYAWLLVNSLYLIIPAIIVFVIGFVATKKQNNDLEKKPFLFRIFITVSFRGCFYYFNKVGAF